MDSKEREKMKNLWLSQIAEQVALQPRAPFIGQTWLGQCREWVRKYDPVRPEFLAFKNPAEWYSGSAEDAGGDVHHYSFVRELSNRLPPNAIVTYDTGGNAIMMGHAFQSKTGQRIFSSNGNSAMGFSMCAAIGAWFADPTRPIICVVGDGGVQLNLQEAQTIKHYGVKIKVFIINNFCLGNTAAYQIQNGKKPLACGPDGYSAPDFVEISKAYGIFASRIALHIGVYGMIDTVLGLDEAVICDVQHPYFCDYKPRMSLWNAGVEEMFPPLPEDEFRSNMLIEPLAGWQDRRKQYKDLSR